MPLFSRPTSPITVAAFPDHGTHATPREVIRFGNRAYATYPTMMKIHTYGQHGFIPRDIYDGLWDKIQDARWCTVYDAEEEWPLWGLDSGMVPMWLWWHRHGVLVQDATAAEEEAIADQEEELDYLGALFDSEDESGNEDRFFTE